MLSGKYAVVTGGSRGIGLEIARIFLEQGAHVLAASRDPQKLASAMQELPALEVLAADVSQPADVERLADWVRSTWGRLDLLVNNAGIYLDRNTRLPELGDTLFLDTLHVNVAGPFYCTKRLLPMLLNSPEPRVINIGSTSGIMGSGMEGVYGVSKAALHALALAFARDLRGKVAVNVVSPGWVKTDMAPDGPGHPRHSAEIVLRVAQQPLSVTGRFFADSGELAWADR